MTTNVDKSDDKDGDKGEDKDDGKYEGKGYSGVFGNKGNNHMSECQGWSIVPNLEAAFLHICQPLVCDCCLVVCLLLLKILYHSAKGGEVCQILPFVCLLVFSCPSEKRGTAL